MKKLILFLSLCVSVVMFAQKKITNQVVEASCGMCQFNQKSDKGCFLNVKIDQKIYEVVGTTIHDHGNAHADDGFCNKIRKAKVTGVIKKNQFVASSFTLLPEKK